MSLFVIGLILVLLRLFIDHIICPHQGLPNLPKNPKKLGYKSKRHSSCSRRSWRRKGKNWPCHNPRKSAHI